MSKKSTETVRAAANRLRIEKGTKVRCPDGVDRKVTSVTDAGLRVKGTRTLIDPRKLIPA